MNRDDHERAIFEKALNLPGAAEPYDIGQPFDADTLVVGFTVDERVVHAGDDPVLGEMAARAEQAWQAFLAAPQDDDSTP
jgi:hypothetical protein